MTIMNDGFATTIAFASTPGVAGVTFKEKEVTPPAIQGGGENDTTTMRNSAWRTRQPKQLKTLDQCSFAAAYDPALYDTILALINVNQLITVTFPDGDTLAFWGWLDEFTPGAQTEGEQPEADLNIICSNQNATGVETAPVFTAA